MAAPQTEYLNLLISLSKQGLKYPLLHLRHLRLSTIAPKPRQYTQKQHTNDFGCIRSLYQHP